MMVGGGNVSQGIIRIAVHRHTLARLSDISKKNVVRSVFFVDENYVLDLVAGYTKAGWNRP